jgi:predicted MFS family arabinose efflux permease
VTAAGSGHTAQAATKPQVTAIDTRLARMRNWLDATGVSSSPDKTVKVASWQVLRDRRFLGYFSGSLISNIGTWLQNTVQMLLAYRLTHSAFAVGTVTCLQFSGFLFSPWTGARVSRMGSRQTLVTTQLASAAISAVLFVLQAKNALTEPLLMAGALSTGWAFALALPVQNVMVSSLVPPGKVKAAMAMNSVSYNAGRTVAPALCVAVVATVGAQWAFALNAISFVVFACTIASVHPASTGSQGKRPPDRKAFNIAWSRPRILLLLAIVATVTIADDPVLVLGPSLAHQVLGVSNVWPAYFLSALGLGTLLGALIPTRPPTSHRAAVSLLVLALSVIVFCAGFTAWVSLVAAIAAGVAALLTGAATQALLIHWAGDGQAAKVMALWALAWAGSKPLASFADGALASRYGVFTAGVLLALPALAVAGSEIVLPRFAKDSIKRFAAKFRQDPTANQAT